MIDRIKSTAAAVPKAASAAATAASSAATAAASAVPRAASAVPRAVSAVPRAASSAASAVPRAVGSLYSRAIDRVLAQPYQITTADEARALLDDPESIDVSAFADQIQQVAIIAIPVVRRLAMFRHVPGVKKVPWVLSIITVANMTRSIRQGVREVQVVGSYVAARLEAASGQPPDPDLVKRLTVQLYLSPSRRPNLSNEGLPTGRLLRRWLTYGLVGRTTNKVAVRAVGAVERLDVGTLPG